MKKKTGTPDGSTEAEAVEKVESAAGEKPSEGGFHVEGKGSSAGGLETPVLSTAEVQKLLQELNIHQIELQMQNEELRTAQVELAHSRDVYAELYDFAPVGYLTLDAEGHILEANFTAATLLGLERGKLLVGRAFAGFVYRDSLEEWGRHRRYLVEHLEKHGIDLSLQRPDGSLLHAHIECTPRPDSGRYLMVLVDITERVQAEEALHKSEEALAELNLELERIVEERTIELQESEARFRRIFEEAPDASFLIDLEGCFIAGNKAVEVLIGYRNEELEGKSVFESGIFPTRARELAAQRIKQLDRTQERLAPVEYSLRHKDGGEITVEVSTLPIRLQGSPVLLSNVRDLTARKRAERQLFESEARFHELFEHMTSGVAVYEVINDGEDFVFGDLNKAGERISGVKKADVLGRRITEMLPRIEETSLLEVFRRVWNTGVPECQPATRYADDRIQVWVETRVFKLPSGELVAVYDDRTDSKQAEQNLRESEEKYRSVFDSETDATLIFDGETRRFIDVNAAALELYGYTHEEFLHLTQSDITAEPTESDASIRQMLAGSPVHIPLRQHRKKDGTVFPVEISACSFSWKGRPVLCGVIRDITQRVEHEKEIENNRKELRQLASELSLAEQRERRRVATELHDGVSQLLSSSYLRLSVLKTSPLPETAVEALDTICGILQDTLQQVRSLSFELSCPMLNELGLAAALEDLCSSMSHEQAVRFDFEGDMQPLPMHLDQRLVLYRAARELLINVMKHSESSWARVTLERAAGSVRICVEDHGKGFDASMAGKGFSPSGGFGLFNIREYLHHAGGNLEIESSPGDGTHVMLTVPLEEDHG